MLRISHKILTAALVAAVAIQCQSATGQEEDSTPDGTTTESVTEMTVMAVDDAGGAPAVFFSSGDGTMSAPMIPGIGAGGSLSMPAPDPWNMIGNPSVQMDLNLVDDQKDQIKGLKKEMSEEMRDLMGQLQGGNINPDVISRLKSAQSDYQEKMMELLLPNQKDRLKQIALQMHMKNAGTTTAITNKAVAEALGITPEQTEKMKSMAKDQKKKLADTIEKLKAEMKNELLSVLTPDQRDKLSALKGDKYEPKKSDWSDRFKGLRRRVKTENN